LLTAFMLSSIAAATVGAFVGLVEVTLAFALIEREAATERAPRRQPGAAHPG
jgi:hypothetical protein